MSFDNTTAEFNSSSTETLEDTGGHNNRSSLLHWVIFTGTSKNILVNVGLVLKIFFLGLNFVGNSLIILLMTRPRFKETSFGVYFILLAITDICVGFFVDVQTILKLYDIDIWGQTDFQCQFWFLAVQGSQEYSGFCLSALSVDRCIAICKPHKAQVSAVVFLIMVWPFF